MKVWMYEFEERRKLQQTREVFRLQLAGKVDLCPNHANKISALAGLMACITMAFMPHCHNLFWIYSYVAAYGLLTGVMRTLSPSIMALIVGPDISSAMGIHMLIYGLMSLAGI